MDKSNLILFWSSFAGLMLITTICAAFNQVLYKRLQKLTAFLKETLKPALHEYRPNEEREMVRDQFPILENWTDASLWYSLITFSAQIVLFLIGGIMEMFHTLPILVLYVLVCLLGSMVMFFPRTITRFFKVKESTNHYFTSYAEILKIKESTKHLDVEA